MRYFLDSFLSLASCCFSSSSVARHRNNLSLVRRTVSGKSSYRVYKNSFHSRIGIPASKCQCSSSSSDYVYHPRQNLKCMVTKLAEQSKHTFSFRTCVSLPSFTLLRSRFVSLIRCFTERRFSFTHLLLSMIANTCQYNAVDALSAYTPHCTF